MQKLLREYLDELNTKRKKNLRAGIALLLLAVMVVGSVAGILSQYGVAMTGGAVCGIEEHKHNESCYMDAIACGLEESAGHTHGEECRYPAELNCTLEENEQHTHGAECYQIPEGFACGLEENAGHTHSEACHTKELTCGKEEHTHTDICYIDRNADLETEEVWVNQYAGIQWTGAWGADLVTAAQRQVGYQESISNYVVAENGIHKGYTRYGQFAGDPYTDWDAAFVNFCMHYAGLGASGYFPDTTDSALWQDEFGRRNPENTNYLAGALNYVPQAGDLVFFQKEDAETAVQMGIVSLYKEETGEIQVIEGNSQNAVQENVYAAGDPRITGYLKVTELETAHKIGTEPAALEDSENQPERVIFGTDDTLTADDEPEAIETLEENGEPEPAEKENETPLTEEERQQADAAAALIAALPDWEEISERFTALMDAEDEEGCAAYYEELYSQVQEAQNAYEALTESQKAQVANAEKLAQFEWMQAETLEENSDSVWGVMGEDEAYVNEVKVTGMTTGSAPFDAEEGLGNDTKADDKIVRTFDTVTYNFSVNMKSWDSSKSYSEARAKLEFVLPLTEKEAVFDQTAMAWMDQTEGYQPEVTTETRIIEGEEKTCQVLTCYKRLLPSAGNQSVIPGDFGENLTINVLAAKNGEEFAPMISVAMEGGAWENPCDKEEHKIDGQPVMEKKSVAPDKVRVTAAPRYNIQIEENYSYKDNFNFQGDEEWMNKYGNVAANTDIGTPVPGRIMKLGITLQLYNDNEAKGLKGIELPTGDITFDLKVSSKYKINQPNEGYTEKQEIDTSREYCPLLWSYGQNWWREYGELNTDGRVLYDPLAGSPLAPYSEHWKSPDDDTNSCWRSGTWEAKQDRDTGTIHIRVSGYEINIDQMPTMNGDKSSGNYGPNVGCFSSGAIWIVQPFNTITGEEHGEEPSYDVVNKYGEGAFATTVKDTNLKATTLSGVPVEQGKDGFEQMVTNDDEKTRTLELTLSGGVQNRVRYASATDPKNQGSGVEDTRDGRDYAALGSELYVMGGLSYDPKREPENQLYLGTNLTKFYGSAIELIENDWFLSLEGGGSLGGETDNDKARANMRIRYATKPDGKDWTDDEELKTTYEDELVFYESLSAIPKGHVCVGILFSFIGPGAPVNASDPYYLCYHKAKIREDSDLVGNAYMLASTSRVWSKKMYEQDNKSLEGLPDWTDPETDFSKFPAEHYTSANITGSTWYDRENYKPDGSGICGDHNSDWSHWGDTLLVIGYKTKVSKYLMQKDNNGGDKKTFNLDAGQRVADFKLEPGTYYDKPDQSDQFKNTDTVTIIDTLPKYMSYKPGSAYFGGTYEQASQNGGTQGNIVTDLSPEAKFPEPKLKEPEVTKNADGTQTLTWRLTDVKIGTPMAPIYYSVEIGSKGNPEEDVPTGTTNLENKVYISAPGDLRDPATTGEKHSESGIAVTRGSASSFGKYTKQKVADEDGEIDYVVYYNNNAETGTSLTLMDTMPMNGENKSHFTGTYRFAQWKLDVSKCNVNNIEIYYTFDEQYKNKTTKDVTREEIEMWTKASIGADGTIGIPTDADGATAAQPYPVAWAVVGTLEARQSVNIELKIQLEPGASDTDRKETNYFVNLLSSGDTTTTTETPTVRRILEGLAWMDYNQDGLQDEPETETRISGIRVELLKLKEGENPENESSYENVYYPGTDQSVAVETGQQISVRAENGSKAVDYETGRYKFTDLSAGTYAVRFTDGSGETKIAGLNATGTDCGEDDSRDSDAVAVRKAEDGTLVKTNILKIDMPKAEDMSVSVFESKFHDSGFYPDTQLKIQKTDMGGNNLQGAIFTIQDEKGDTLSFTYDEDRGYTPYDEEGENLRKGKYYIAFAKNPYYVVGINGTENGSLAILQNRTGAANQLFEVMEHEDGSYSFRTFSGSWLDLDSGRLEDGAKIHVWSGADPDTNKKWYVSKAEDGGSSIAPYGGIHWGNDNWRMDLNGNRPEESGKIHLWSKNNSDAQKWVLIPAGSTAETQTDLNADSNGSLIINNLKPGSYTITEIKSPEGYSLLKGAVGFTVNGDGSIAVTDSVGNMAAGSSEGEATLTIKNAELYELPSAGGSGIYWYSIGGTLLMLAAALILYKNKRREVLER
ncbi:MAG: LPXTG cell wall anchor domain-containing protein [Lachnospiraceae bacterium]|nr:LPXTG cell wall anchor domain-containing protein [Lachnospiraceae bacterium]